MRTAAILTAAAAFGLASCASYAPAPPYGSTTLTVATKPPYGTYLVGPNGLALYVLEGERVPVGMSRCTADCLRVWPPVHTSGPPVAGPGIDPGRLGTVPMHGAAHVTYAGWPLYYYRGDRTPGDTTGQHVTDRWGMWHLLSPSGEPIRPAAHH